MARLVAADLASTVVELLCLLGGLLGSALLVAGLGVLLLGARLLGLGDGSLLLDGAEVALGLLLLADLLEREADKPALLLDNLPGLLGTDRRERALLVHPPVDLRPRHLAGVVPHNKVRKRLAGPKLEELGITADVRLPVAGVDLLAGKHARLNLHLHTHNTCQSHHQTNKAQHERVVVLLLRENNECKLCF